MTDLKRLHDAILDWEKTFSTRQSGKTRIILHSVIGEIQIGLADHIFLICRLDGHIYSLKKEFLDCLVGQGVSIVTHRFGGAYGRYKLRNEDGKMIDLFIVGENSSGITMRGYHNYAVYHLDWEEDSWGKVSEKRVIIGPFKDYGH